MGEQFPLLRILIIFRLESHRMWGRGMDVPCTYVVFVLDEWGKGGMMNSDCTPIEYPPSSACSKSLLFLPHPPSRLLLAIGRGGMGRKEGGGEMRREGRVTEGEGGWKD